MAVVIGIAGFSNSGKTTLLEKIISKLKQDDISVGVIKHTPHDIDLDYKDTGKFFRVGADEVVASAKEMVLKISRLQKERSLFQIIKEMESLDIIFVEGYKEAEIPKIIVLRKGIKEGYDLVFDEMATAVIFDDSEILNALAENYAGIIIKNANKSGENIRISVKGTEIPAFLFQDVQGIVEFIKIRYLPDNH